MNTRRVQTQQKTIKKFRTKWKLKIFQFPSTKSIEYLFDELEYAREYIELTEEHTESNLIYEIKAVRVED